MTRTPARRRREFAASRRGQRGVVAILVGLTMAVMIGFVGLALDGGHLYLTKTELQNSADACALAASRALTGAPAIAAEAFVGAEAAGRAVAKQNKVNYQGTNITDGMITVRFSNALSAGTSWVPAAAAPPTSKYVRCTIERRDISPLFMKVVGAGDQIVNSLATATLAPAQSNCAVPMALCVQPGGVAPDFGYVAGNWYGMDFRESGGAANYTGNFRWIDFDPSSATPGCAGGGAQELACLMRGSGQCSLPPPIPAPGGCSSSGSSTPTPGCVGQNGAINALQAAYNTRFGLYGPGSATPATSPPDFTGYAYDWDAATGAGNWPIGRDAYNGTVPSGLGNFKTARTGFLAANDGTEVTPNVDPRFYRNPYVASTGGPAGVHGTQGADRRLVTVPIVECSSFSGGQHAPARAYACILLVDPYRLAPGNEVKSKLEYLGRSNVLGSPCATSGVVGDDTSIGPMVPALVQ